MFRVLGRYNFALRFRLKGPDFGFNSEEIDEDEREIRVVLTAPHKGQFLSDPSFYHLKFTFSEKATKIDNLTVCSNSQRFCHFLWPS